MNNFIYTQNPQTASTLLQRGFNLFQKNNGMWIFVNNTKLTFSDIEGVILTNKLFV